MSVEGAETSSGVDVDLVRRAQSELPYNMTSFKTLAELHYQWMCKLSGGIVSDPAMAQSLAQDALLRAMHGLPALKEPEKFRSWLGTITINVSKSYLTREKKEAEKRERFAVEATELSQPAEPRDENFYEMISPLSTEEKTLVCLKIIDEFDFQEISTILGIELSATKMRYYRSLEKIKRTLR